MEHVFLHNLRACATKTPNGSDYSTDPIVVGLARDAAISEIARTDLKKVLTNYYKLDDTQVIIEAQRLIDANKEITPQQGMCRSRSFSFLFPSFFFLVNCL